jgi:hypothetical protein
MGRGESSLCVKSSAEVSRKNSDVLWQPPADGQCHPGFVMKRAYSVVTGCIRHLWCEKRRTNDIRRTELNG